MWGGRTQRFHSSRVHFHFFLGGEDERGAVAYDKEFME